MKEKEFGLPEWAWIIIGIVYGSLNNILVYFLLAVFPAYLFSRWKRKQFFTSGLENWKTIRGVLIDANAALILVSGSIYVYTTMIYEKFGGAL